MSAPPQALPASTEPVAIVSPDPNSLTSPLRPIPYIADIIRTQYCVPGSVFLVESVDADIPTGKGHRTVRLLLGDGELCIQALLLPELHGFVGSGRVRAGCYVRLNTFALRSIPIGQPDGDGGDAQAQPKMVYLLLQDILVVGWDAAYLDMLRAQSPPEEPAEDCAVVLRGGMSPRQDSTEGNKPHGGGAAAPALSSTPVDDRQPSPRAQGPSRPIDDLQEDTTTRTADMHGPKEKHAEQRDGISTVASYEPHPPGQYGHLPWATDDPGRPVKLTALRAIPTLPYKQNWMVNVLAVVASVSDMEPSHMPPYRQRTARLADPSTTKRVLLTVFLDADEFAPAVGSVVLLLGVKNHRFDGGSLKKYVSDRLKSGMRWWVENPKGLEWCNVAGLREWWDGMQEDGAA